MVAVRSSNPHRSLTFNSVIRLLSLLLLVILIAVAAILYQNAHLLLDPSAASYQTKKLTVPLPQSSSRQIKSEISQLENKLDKLAKEALKLNEEVHLLETTRNKHEVNEQDNERRSSEKGTINEREPKKWWVRRDPYPVITDKSTTGTEGGSIIAVNLSVNHLQLTKRAPGSPNEEHSHIHEEFLPVVLQDDIEFRWRSEAKTGANTADIQSTTAYRIAVRLAHTDTWIWDSRRIETDGLPDVVKCTSKLIEVGFILEWQVMIWDENNKQSTSEWSKFAVGPSSDAFISKWITHPVDMSSWSKGDAGAFWRSKNEKAQKVACDNWHKRKQLPIFRAQLPILDKVQTALLVVSGLGSFRSSIDGVPLSSSGPLDPPLTDFAQRVSYRGFDITPFMQDGESHVIGIASGSGWWDHRPIKGSFIRLWIFPHGPNTINAQIHVTYQNGKRDVVLPTGSTSAGWQVTKGHLRESSLFSGEYIDLGAMSTLNDWDTNAKWSELDSSDNTDEWKEPSLYESDVTLDTWRYQLHIKSNAISSMVSDNRPTFPDHKVAPIGKLVPHEAPPVLPMAKIYPDEVYSLGDGRWMIDFGVGFSGMVRFGEGLPDPILPETYPRGHTVTTLDPDESFITVVYGERLELSTGDINLPLVAGMGLHDGGPKHKSKQAGSAEAMGGVCYPADHIEAGSLMQRDVYILPKDSTGSFSNARQSHFTTHAFRFAEVCCTANPPEGVYALSYRSGFQEWGEFSSSNIRINGGYELVRNALNSNLLSVQSDCPHREKIQYGGDINADAPSALHFYDMSAFYRKVVYDWIDQQWDNGAYAGTSYWLALNDYAGIGDGAGETVWATAAPLTTVRHFQHYGDLKLLRQTFTSHLKWYDFLREKFDKGMKVKGYDTELKGYVKEGSGLGDWLTFRGRDTWLTHESFYMAVARCIAYMANRMGSDLPSSQLDEGIALAKDVKERISRLYLMNGNDCFLPPESAAKNLSPGPEMSLFSRVVPGSKRCSVLRNYFRREGHTWPGSEEMRFIAESPKELIDEMVETKEISKRGSQWAMGWSQWHGFNEGIFAIRYSLKTLSDNGFHNVALGKATGFGVGTWEYLLSHNATTHWESWWRSEDLYSHNHPMLGASAEWMASSVGGVALSPTTSGGKEVIFWPRFPNSARDLEYASTTQGTRRGDFSIAWRFQFSEGERKDNASVVSIHIRAFVPPDGKAIFRVPEYSDGKGSNVSIKYAKTIPNLKEARALSKEECQQRRKAKMGFNYNWEFNRDTSQWYRVYRKKAIGTPCNSFLFHDSLNDVEWSPEEEIVVTHSNGVEIPLKPGMYYIVVNEWQLKPEVESNNGRIGSLPQYFEAEDVGPYCADTDTFEWNIDDAIHLI